MFNLKGIFFYFLAIKIILTKAIKRFYFRTNYYYKSLKSEIPKQFYFYPNPFLLSSLTNHQNFSFKIENVNLEILWSKPLSVKNEKNLNNFFWLSLIDRKNDGVIIQKIISKWIFKNQKYKKIVWDSDVLSKRVISWILNSEIILNNTDNNFKDHFLQSIVIQINHLKKNIEFQNNYSKKIENITAILLSGLVFKEYNDNFDFAIKELEKLVENFFDNQGFPNSRNPNDLVQISKYLILIKECSKDAQNFIPEYLDDIIEKNLNCLNSIKTSRNETPLFNGNTENKIDKYLEYVRSLDYKFKKNKNLIGNIYILKNKKQNIFFDVGEPPKKSFSNNYQSGPLSFEYYINENKIITNCGFGSKISKKAELLSRLTSAQSTLCINDTSVTKFERNKLINSTYGALIKNNFKTSDINFFEEDNSVEVTASHNAYENLGYIHKRVIKIKKNNEDLLGSDILIKKKDKIPLINYAIRFHLYPGISAVKTIGEKSIVLQIEKNKSLVFSSENEKILIEKSIFLGRNQILNNFCITIYGTINNEEKKIDWIIKKNS